MERNVTFNRLPGRIALKALRNAITARTRAHAADEEGGITIIGLFIIILMLSMGGISVDIMRHEMERTQLQATLDSAVLAGAGAPAGATKAEMKAIVEDFFLKSGKGDYLNEIGDDDILASLNARSVTASADMTMSTYLMKLMGVNYLTAGGGATAEVRTPKLEVVLVLDSSGSMGSNNKLVNLKVAAKEFVSSLILNSNPGDVVFSIVPFSWSVTPNLTTYETLAIDEDHQYSTCLAFRDNDYTHATLTSGASALSNGVPVRQMLYTSVYGSFDNLNQAWRSCFTEAEMEILAYSISESQLHAKIDGLFAEGNTSGHQGMNWGAALLDPTFRQVSDSMRLKNELDPAVQNIPADYGEPETLKVIVMMGDGANTTSYFFDRSSPKFRGPHSAMYLVKQQDRVFKYAYHIYKHTKSNDESRCSRNRWECIYEANGPEESVYYLRHPSGDFYYSIEAEEWITSSEFNNLENLAGFISREQLSWETAWGLMSPNYYGQITGDWSAWNDYVGSEYESGADKDTKMLNVCSATKTEGVIVYSIGFEIPAGGNAENVLRNCASSPSNYFRAEGLDIRDAFGAIAANVQNLRLTQ